MRKTSELLCRWGRSIRQQNNGETKHATGYMASIFGKIGYRAPGVNDDDARERADAIIHRMDVDRITKIIDKLDQHSNKMIHIRFVNSDSEAHGLYKYKLYRGVFASLDDYRRETQQSIAVFESAYNYKDSANALTVSASLG